MKYKHNTSLSNYRKKFPDSPIFDEVAMTKIGLGSSMRKTIPDSRGNKNPMYGRIRKGEQRSQEFKERCSLIKKESWKDPDHYYNSEEYRNKLSIAQKNNHADPNSVFNTREYHCKLSLRVGSGFGKKGYSLDGHHYQSNYELVFDDLLFNNRIKHEIHPLIPDSTRRADFLVNGFFVEIDGMSRSVEYWTKRYKTCYNRLIVVDIKNRKRKEDLSEFFIRSFPVLRSCCYA